jgi:tRNA (mo5U34)-methyltransferase
LVEDDMAQALERSWYHRLELRPGVWTDGWFDLTPLVPHYGLPDDMTGMRVLEVGTWDGFWAFEMERRGASVVAIDLDDERDLDWPPRRRPDHYPEEPRGAGFALAKRIKDSSVERVVCSVYHALPEDLGTFDLVFCGSVLMHLRDQFLALERMAALCGDSGYLICANEYHRRAGLIPMPTSVFVGDHNPMVFWMPSIKTWKRMMWAAGFDRVDQKGTFRMKARDVDVRHVVLHGHRRA